MIYENIINEVSDSGGILCHKPSNFRIEFRDHIFDSTKIANQDLWRRLMDEQMTNQLKARLDASGINGELSHSSIWDLPKETYKVEFDIPEELKSKIKLGTFDYFDLL